MTLSPAHPALGGPVSAALEGDLREKVRRHGVVVWLGQADHDTAFIDHLMATREAGRIPYDLHAFGESHLGWIVSLEGGGRRGPARSAGCVGVLCADRAGSDAGVRRDPLGVQGRSKMTSTHKRGMIPRGGRQCDGER